MQEQKNIYTIPEGARKVLIKRPDDFYEEIQRVAFETCRGSVPQGYIDKSIRQFEGGYLYVIGNKIIGFILWKIIKNKQKQAFENITGRNTIPSKYLDILLLCAKKTDTNIGYTLLFDAEKYCLSKVIPFMKISPINSKVQQYYKQYGFITGSTIGDVVMYKPVNELILEENNTRKISSRKKTRKNPRKSIFTEDDKRIIDHINTNGRDLENTLSYQFVNKNFFNDTS
jgi:hypothetical protein